MVVVRVVNGGVQMFVILDPDSGAQIISQDYVTKNNIKLKRLPRAECDCIMGMVKTKLRNLLLFHRI